MGQASASDKRILLVEDNHDDVLLTQMAFEKAGHGGRIYAVSSGFEGIAYLNGDPPYSDRFKYPVPLVVLLDLKMPGTDGFQVLQWIRSQSKFAQLRVVMLTGSAELGEMDRAYRLGADSFVVKPLDRAHAAELSGSLDQRLAA